MGASKRLRCAAGVLLAAAAGSAAASPQVLRPLVSGDGGVGDRFGAALAASPDTLAVGAFSDLTITSDGIVSDGSVTLYSIVGNTLVRGDALRPKDITRDDNGASFGYAVAIEGDRLAIGAPGRNGGNGDSAGAVYLFERSGGAWSEVAQVTSPVPAALARFGSAVALSDGRLFVGAPGEQKAYVFESNGLDWTATATIDAPPGAIRFAEALTACSDRLVIGDPAAAAPAAPARSGIAYRYDRSGIAWPGGAAITGSGAVVDGGFGKHVACEGSLFVVGASGDPLGASLAAGRAFVFDLAAATTELDVLSPVASAVGDGFGSGLAIEGDVIAVGAYTANVGEGSMTFFERSGNDWTAIDTVIRNDGLFADALGTDVALAGNLAFGGAPLDARGEHRAEGSVERFERNGNDFASLGVLDRGRGAGRELFGAAVATVGGQLFVGAPKEVVVLDEDDAGTISIFGKTGDAFVLGQKRESPEPESFDQFGSSLAMAADLAVVGTPDAIVNGESSAGAAFVYRRVNGQWSYEAKLVAPGGLRNDAFGFAVATDGARILVGAPFNDERGENAGAAYVFDKTGSGWIATKLTQASDGEAAGYTVALRDGLIALGAPAASKPNAAFAGAIYVWRLSGGSWTPGEKLFATPASAFQQLGTALAIDGGLVIAGADNEKIAGLAGAGAVYMFGPSNNVLAQRQRIVRPAPTEGEAFGSAVAAQAGVLIVGAPYASDAAEAAGVALRYAVDGNGQFQFQSALAPDAPQYGAAFGAAVALDESVVAVGEPGRGVDNPDEGAVYVFVDPDTLFKDSFE